MSMTEQQQQQYHNLILTIGAYESSTLTNLVFGTPIGYDTPKEIMIAFREAILNIIKEKIKQDESGVCSKCEIKTRSGLEIYCSFCGRRLNRERDLNSEAASFFQGLFGTQLHEFIEWEWMADQNWYVGRFYKGRYFLKEGFEGMLEDWENIDFDHLNTETQSAGLISPDKEAW